MNCPFCNQNIPDGSTFCGYCGNKLPEAAQAVAENAAAVAAETAETVQSAENVVNNAVETAAAVTAAVEAPAAAVAEAAPTSAENADAAANPAPVDLEKAGTAQGAKQENEVVNQIKEGVQGAAEAVQNDTREAVAAVKSGNFADLLKNKTFLICCGAILAVITLVIIIAGCAALGKSGSKVKGTYVPVVSDGDLALFYNGKQMKGVDLSSSASLLDGTPDGTTAVLEDDDALYLIKNGKITEITDDFDTTRARISANGKTVVYVSDDSVYVYTGSKPQKIADLEDDRYCNPVVSPDGKVVVYADMDDDDIKTYAWKGGSKVIDLDTDVKPISVSNGGKIIFGENRNGDLYFLRNLKPGTDEKLRELDDVVGISTDHTKLLYTSEDCTYCFDLSISSKEDVRITRNTIRPYAETYYDDVPYIDNFKSFLGRENGSVYKYFRKGKEYDDEKLISSPDAILVSDDYKSFVYIDDDDVMKGTFANAKNAKKVGKDAISLRAGDDLKTVFYLDDDRTLRYAGKDGKIASDVNKYVVMNNGVCVFSDYDGELYYSVKGGEKKKVGLDEISGLSVRGDILFVVSDDMLYISKNGKSFAKTGVDVG